MGSLGHSSESVSGKDFGHKKTPGRFPVIQGLLREITYQRFSLCARSSLIMASVKKYPIPSTTVSGLV